MSSLDHLVGKLLELRWHIKAECRGAISFDFVVGAQGSGHAAV
jgi:hypothetical protein